MPEELFELVSTHIGQALGVRTTLTFETSTSGPERGRPDLFTAGEVDVGFVCSPSYFWLADAVELVPAAFAFAEPRAAGRPVYHSDVIVRRENAARGFHELGGARWAYNDTCSLSGYWSFQRRVAALGGSEAFLGELQHSGSHLASIRRVALGEADAAAIDSNVLFLQARAHPAMVERVRVVESWGPFPVQPVIVRAALPFDVKAALAGSLLAMHRSPAMRGALEALGVERFVPVAPSDFDGERTALAACEGAMPAP